MMLIHSAFVVEGRRCAILRRRVVAELGQTEDLGFES